MKFTPLSLSGVFTIEPELREDARGAFARTFCVDEFAARGLETQFVQANQSWNTKRNTLRGLHFQYPPFAEVKFLRCIVGSVWDVIIDIRKGSPTFLQHLAVELSAKNKVGLYIPAGFAHGFITLEDDTELIYMHSNTYAPGHEGGFRWDDPALGIQWPNKPVLMSEKDESDPLVIDFEGIVI